MADPLLGPNAPGFDSRQATDRLFQLVTSLVTNPLNQINRIGGQAAEPIPVYDPSLSFGDVGANAGLPPWAQTVLELVGGAVEPGPGELRMLGDLAPLAASVPGLFRKLGRAADTGRDITREGGTFVLNGAELTVGRNPDGSVQVENLINRDGPPGAGSQLSELLNLLADEEQVTLRTTVSPYGQGVDYETAVRRGIERKQNEGFQRVPGTTSDLVRLYGRGGGGR